MKKVDPVRPTSIRTRRPTARAETVVLLLILLVAAGLRLYRLGAQSLWYDEGVTAQVVSLGISELTRWTAGDIQPPLYYYVVWVFARLVGHSEWALRFPSALLSVLLVPLSYLLGKRLFDSRSALVAAMLATTSPLYVYYGQEARMYTMLTAMGMVAALLLLAVLDSTHRKSRRGLWIGCAVVCIAALYTHDFAGFLLLAIAIYLLVKRWRDRVLLLEGLVTAAVVAACYSPWLPAMITRFRDDASYWAGTLKLHEAVRHLLISFSMGETVLEDVAVALMWGFAALLLLSVLALAFRRARQTRRPSYEYEHSPLLFLLLYLLVPLLSVLLLSYSNPKFNPRYLMLGSPAFLLLISAGIACSWGVFVDRARRLPLGVGLGALSAAGMAFVLGVSGYSLWNWFNDPAFSKAQFREVARYVTSHAEPDETVVLTSGHMSPVWDYYAPQLERHRIPDMDILDVSATLGYHTADELNRVLAGKRGVWTVLWQDSVVDPNGFLAEFLGEAGEEQMVDESFWQVGLRHYRLPADVTIRSAPSVQHRIEANFAGQVELLGWSDHSSGHITLHWQALAGTSSDLKLSLVLEDHMGHQWGRSDRRPAAYSYPTFRWSPGETIFAHIEIPAVAGTPPASDYRLRVSLYDESDGAILDVLDVASNPQGEHVYLDGMVIPSIVGGDALGQLLARPGGTIAEVDVGAELRMRGYAFDASPMRAGERRTLSTLWEAVSAHPDLNLRYRLLADDGIVVLESRLPTGVGGDSGALVDQWQEGQVLLSQADVIVPARVTSQGLTLELVAAQQGQQPIEPIELLGFPLIVPDRVWSPPAMDVELGAELEGRVSLLGMLSDRHDYSPGQTLSVTVVWQPSTDLSDWDLTGFVHLLDENGRSVSQEDHIPQRGERPTRGWLRGEVVTDRYDLAIAPDAPPGDYAVEVGLYQNDGTRWVVSAPERWSDQDSVIVTTISVR